MGAFHFRLQSVLNMKEQLEKEQKEAFSQANAKLNELTEFGEKIEKEYRQWSFSYIQTAQAGTNPSDAIRIFSYLSELQELTEKNRERLKLQEEEVENQRVLLVEKMRERKLMETLRDRQCERFTKEEQKKQEKETEDMILAKMSAN